MNTDTPAAFYRLHRRRRTWMHRAAVCVLALCCAAATYVATVDVLQWRTADESARRVALSSEASEKERREAVVVLLRNVRASVDCLRTLAARQDPLGEQARLALRHIGESLR